MALIEIDTVSKGFHGLVSVTALRDVSLVIGEGEFVSLLGPSGCGKSTLLMLIAGLEAPTAGEVRFRGRPVTGPGRERYVVFQESSLFPWRTVLGNVTIGLEGRVRDGLLARAREYLRLVGLEGFEHAFPRHLSGGMKQRVALARALAMKAEVLLMDEPFAAVDAQTRDALQAELLKIWERERKTILFVTHSIEEALFLSQRVVVLSPRPATVREEVEVPPGSSRDYEFRTTAEFGRLKAYLYRQLSVGGATP
jgi:NitT/TauT family transport system ATP-binding protein